MRRRFGAWLACLSLGAAPISAAHAETRRAAAQLTRFEAALAAEPSATHALEGWCGLLTGSDHTAITAQMVPGENAPRPTGLAGLLGVSPATPLAYRHVRLSCRIGTLSEAHNWYVPARLTPEMNAALAQTDTPFGRVVAPLHFTREALTSKRGRGVACPAHTILTNRALLRLPNGQPLALVVDCYTARNLARPVPSSIPAPAPLSSTP